MNPIDLPLPGFHMGLSYEQYAAWPAINFSRLKPIRSTPSKCKYEMEHPKEMTPAMKLGSALHVAVLEPARFESIFYICPPCDRRTTEGKQAYAEHEKAANGKLILRQGSDDGERLIGEVQKLKGMAASIRNFNAAAPFLNGPGQNEVSALWKDEETELMCKARFDRFIPTFEIFEGIPVIVEIKTDQDASDWEFSKTVDKRYYSAQAAGYSHAVHRITGKRPRHIFVVVENFAPFDVAVYTLNDASIQTGYNQYRQMLNRYAECKRTNIWPGYKNELQVLKLPQYAHERNYAN